MIARKVKGFFLITTLSVGLLSNDLAVYANFEGSKSKCITTISKETSKSDPSDNEQSEGSGGSWETKGSKANKVAQDMWDYWKGKGFGGVGIAGVMGNVDHEGGFDIPDRAEGHYGGDSKENGISEGNIPLVGAGYPIGKSGQPEGGAGHYQFTPYSKFAPVGDAKWKSTKEQSDYVWTSEVGHATWLNDYINITSVETAVDVWFTKYERGASLNPAKIESGKKAYEVFGGANVKPDSALAGAKETAEKGKEESEKKEKSSYCSNETKSKTKNNSSSGKIIDYSKELLGYFSYLQVHGESHIGSIDNPKKDGVTDCSGFVWLVLAQAGYKAPDNMAWYTGSMESDAKESHQWLEEIKDSEAKAGDIVIVNVGGGAGSNGHTAFLTEDWKSEPVTSNSTKIIQMGGEGSELGVNEGTFSTSFGLLLNGSETVTFARAIKK